MQDELYRGREQALVKHTLLRNYLAALGRIIGLSYGSVTYVDCFSGPWMASSERLEDTSFSIALGELKAARSALLGMGKQLRVRCFFIEADPDAYQRLETFATKAREPGIEIETRGTKFEEVIPEIVAFVRQDPSSFPFIFIDPTGWKSVEIPTIRPLLEIQPGEVLVNLMTSHLHRFAKTTQLFDEKRLQGLTGMDFDDEMVRQYSAALVRYGNYSHVVAAIILRPEVDSPHYRLIYATRHPRGLQKFKDAERRAMRDMEAVRATAKQRKQEARTGQLGLYPGEVTDNPKFHENLCKRYVTEAKAAVLEVLQSSKRVPYDMLWALAISRPLTFESDLKDWLREWSSGIRIEGLGQRERAPKPGRGHVVTWTP